MGIGLPIAIWVRIGLRRSMEVCIDLDSWGRRSSTSDINSSDRLGDVYHFRDLTLSVLEIVNGDDRILTLVVVVGKRVVQLVVRMSNGASAEED